MFKLFRTAAIAALLTVTTYAVALEKGINIRIPIPSKKATRFGDLPNVFSKSPGCGLKSGKLTRRSTTRI